MEGARKVYPGLYGDLLGFIFLQMDSSIQYYPHPMPPTPPFVAGPSDAERRSPLIVMVIGESANPNFFSVYGYGMNTTPELRKLADDGQITLLRKAHSVANFTKLGVLPYISAWSPDQADSPETVKAWQNILELAKNAGYQTYWLGAPVDEGVYSGMIGYIAAHTDYYFGRSWALMKKHPIPGAPSKLTESEDLDLLPALQKTLAMPDKKPKFIIIHQQGSHIMYSQNADDIDRAALPWGNFGYERAIHHTDRFLGAVIRMLQATGEPFSFIYASDHGEVPGKGHSLYLGEEDYHIPVMLAGNWPDGATDQYRTDTGWFSSNSIKFLLTSRMGYPLNRDYIAKQIQQDYIHHIDGRILPFSKIPN